MARNVMRVANNRKEHQDSNRMTDGTARRQARREVAARLARSPVSLVTRFVRLAQLLAIDRLQ